MRNTDLADARNSKRCRLIEFHDPAGDDSDLWLTGLWVTKSDVGAAAETFHQDRNPFKWICLPDRGSPAG